MTAEVITSQELCAGLVVLHEKYSDGGHLETRVVADTTNTLSTCQSAIILTLHFTAATLADNNFFVPAATSRSALSPGSSAIRRMMTTTRSYSLWTPPAFSANTFTSPMLVDFVESSDFYAVAHTMDTEQKSLPAPSSCW